MDLFGVQLQQQKSKHLSLKYKELLVVHHHRKVASTDA